jgi:hypothetical protein
LRVSHLENTASGEPAGTALGVWYSSDLTDEQWALLEPVFNTQGRRRPSDAPDVRSVVDAMLYIYLPHRLPVAVPARVVRALAAGVLTVPLVSGPPVPGVSMSGRAIVASACRTVRPTPTRPRVSTLRRLVRRLLAGLRGPSRRW